MAAAKKASFASKQVKGGPAPLASFEDLPSDEMDSPNSSRNDPDQDSLCLVSSFEDLNLDSTTPGTVTCSPISAIHIDTTSDQDTESQHTLTPCNAPEDRDIVPICVVAPSMELPGLRKTGEMEEQPRVDNLKTPTEAPQSTSNAANPDELQVALSKNGRKGSWTDIFRRSPQPSPQSPRKGLPELPIEEPKEGKKSKKKSGILSVFRFHDKKPDKRSKSPIKSPINTLSDGPIIPSATRADVEKKTKDTEIKLPKKEVEVEPKELENNTFDPFTESIQNYPDLVVEDVLEAFKHPELKAKLSLERKSKSLDHELPLRDENDGDFKGSSESELASEEPAEKKDDEEIDFEAETLLNQDSIEYDESLISESLSLDVVKVETKTQPRRQRLEVTTVPRPRSRPITPISVAPFEAFIQSAQQTQMIDPSVEKLKVLLPGEQFCGRLKSPKRNLQQKSWQDFCQSGLHSPRITKRPSNEAFEYELSPPVSAFNNQVSPFENTDPVFTQKWETFELSKPNSASDAIVIADQSSSNASDPPSQSFNLKRENFKLSFSSSLSSDSNNMSGSQENDAFDVQLNSKDW